MKLYRQGDVLISQVAQLPEAAHPIEKGGKIVLAWGEVTGHHHRIENDGDVAEAQEFTMKDAAGAVQRFLKVFGLGATVKHEEHAAIALPPGIYEITQQREYAPEAIRNVAD